MILNAFYATIDDLNEHLKLSRINFKSSRMNLKSSRRHLKSSRMHLSKFIRPNIEKIGNLQLGRPICQDQIGRICKSITTIYIRRNVELGRGWGPWGIQQTEVR